MLIIFTPPVAGFELISNQPECSISFPLVSRVLNKSMGYWDLMHALSAHKRLRMAMYMYTNTYCLAKEMLTLTKSILTGKETYYISTVGVLFVVARPKK